MGIYIGINGALIVQEFKPLLPQVSLHPRSSSLSPLRLNPKQSQPIPCRRQSTLRPKPRGRIRLSSQKDRINILQRLLGPILDIIITVHGSRFLQMPSAAVPVLCGRLYGFGKIRFAVLTQNLGKSCVEAINQGFGD